ncbi:MAG: thioredoxin domain-containing protein [Candidatus Methanoperedens sp.]|nr:thioredoxin domain-containing protein [Candidatus Methanoperedens sp.]MCZ7369819.1 thioredoxin domain-containing protein [Candidatus Methanoperedens sp.]
MEDQFARKPNRLINEKSPYLLQHAYNPVDWYPWGEEAFEKAKNEVKPIFLSIGYSTCHWCHVMEKESFEDYDVARLMNDAFVSIKVDREERPDIDSIFMSVCQRMIGSGGWPLNLILTPDKRPFFAATYIPKESRAGRIGMLEMVPRIKDLWEHQRDEVESMASKVVSALRDVQISTGKELGEDVLHAAYEQLLEMFDERHGGFGEAPKFPSPHNLSFLLRYWKRTDDRMAMHIVEKTLSSMSKGGIYDHIGFGFHRYSVDSGWLVPHFEKMLYDQAMLAIAYTEAYQAIGKEEHGETAREIFTYVLRDLTDSEGGFYCGEDADSEGEEGKFYFWTGEEIRNLLGDESELVKKTYGIEEDGNFENGKNILHLKSEPSEIALQLKIPLEDFQKRLSALKDKLFAFREKRVHPGKDDKILTDWNGLMIAALSIGAAVLAGSEYENAAKRAVDFILAKMRKPDGRLYHRYREGEAAVPAFLDDYAFLIWGLIELYESTFEVSYLKAALDLNELLLRHFWDEENGGFYITADDAEEVIYRKKEIYDGAVPSGNSVAMLNLLRLGRITGNPELEKKAVQIERAFSRIVLQAPSAYTQLMVALDFATGPTSEIIIVGDRHAIDTKTMLAALRREFLPNKVVLFIPIGPDSSEIFQLAEYTKNMSVLEGKSTAYVCRNYGCRLPTTDIGKMFDLLN